MKINKLPQFLQDMATANQVRHENEADATKDLDAFEYNGGFNWNTSPEGRDFWEMIWSTKFKSEGMKSVLFFVLQKMAEKHPNDQEFGKAVRSLILELK